MTLKPSEPALNAKEAKLIGSGPSCVSARLLASAAVLATGVLLGCSASPSTETLVTAPGSAASSASAASVLVDETPTSTIDIARRDIGTVIPVTPSAVAANQPDEGSDDSAPGSAGQTTVVEVLFPEVIATYPHDDTAYTQGLEIFEGQLLESTGRAGHRGSNSVFESDLRRVDIETGEVTQRADPPGEVFAEGLTRVGDEIVQITWRDGDVFWWDAASFELLREINFGGVGWGLCYDGERLVMTDGSANLFFRDPQTFDLLDQVTVTRDGQAVAALNELECVDGQIWANVYQTNFIVRVEPTTGQINAVVDASTLGVPRPAPSEVLNGLAFDSETQTWLVTGKFWPSLYRVQFVEAD